MIVAQPRRTEREYRQIPTDSASTLKDFLMDPKKYFNKYVMGEPVEEEDSKSTIIGSLVHCLLLEPQHFDEKYHVSALEDKPTEKMLEFCLSLYKHTISSTDDAGVVTREFAAIAMDAWNEVKPGNWKFDTLMSKFEGSISEDYYNELLLTKPKNLQIVTLNDMKIAEDIILTLKSDDFVGEILCQEDNGEDVTVLTELQLEGDEYQIYGLPMKGMVDKVIIFHETERIIPFDFKVTWEPQNFMEGYYLYRRSYLQAMVYFKLIEIWAGLNGYEDYHIEFPDFIVADSGNFYRPLRYTLSSEQVTGANNGFIHRGKYYKGLQEVITDLKWARDMNEWKITRENYMNKGLVTIKTF